jgi:uncharacterized protein YbaP (TraB family)
MRRWWSLALTLLLALAGGPALAKPPMWVVRDKDSELVLFGSVHLLPPGLDWKPAALSEALPKAQDIWFELPIDDIAEAEAARLAGERGMLPPNDNLWNHLTREQTDRLKRVAARLSLSPAVLERMRPWLVEVTLAVVLDARSGANIANGVEQQLQDQTPPNVTRRAFETPAEQIDLLAGAATPDQVASLDQSMTEIEQQPDQFTLIIGDWMNGDMRSLQSRAVDPLKAASPAVYDRLITQRNRRWMRDIERRLAGSGKTVVVVGVGHLVGEGGLPAMLRAKGYQVEGP